jgi:hypothetical protein
MSGTSECEREILGIFDAPDRDDECGLECVLIGRGFARTKPATRTIAVERCLKSGVDVSKAHPEEVKLPVMSYTSGAVMFKHGTLP